MSASKTQGIGFQPTLGARRDLVSLLSAQRQVGASIRWAVYVENLGDGTHLVKNQCNDQPYRVAEAVQGLSLVPGSSVALGSYAGTPGELLFGSAPLGRGGSAFAPAVAVRVAARYRNVREVTGMCPTPILGHSYVGVVQVGSGTLHLCRYVDGHFQELLSTVALPEEWNTAFNLQRANSGALVCGGQGAVERNFIATISIGSGAVASAQYTANGIIGGPVVLGGLIYFSEGDTVDAEILTAIQMHRVSVGVTGTIDDVPTRYGPRLAPAGLQAPVDGFNVYSDGTIDFLGLVGATDVIPSLTGATWSLGTDRIKFEPGVGFGVGLPAGSGVALRNGGPNGPLAIERAGDEHPLLPSDWRGGPWLGHFSPACYPSPNGAEVACYPCAEISGEDVRPTLCRIRLAALERTGCGIPRFNVDPGPSGDYPSVMIPMD